jgi:hypothetical protein
MRRAIVYSAWGEDYVREASASALSAAQVGVDRILVTDAASVPLVASGSPFERVIEHNFALSSKLAKVEMLDVLPDDYDSFLYLDTDTTVLLDVGQGFERAERHGIAMAQAAHYSLEHFWGFGSVLDRVGFNSRDVLQYNSGVIFFTREPQAWQVLRDWRRLCEEASHEGITAWWDQPYLTLAMEMAAFNPYTLSIAYNYRNFGEPVSGFIRIWHSRIPPPPDVNSFDEPWPPRRFIGSKRLGIGE